MVRCLNLEMTPGQSISHFLIISKLGAGGMGEVWRAIDTKLNREVAIKILPEAFASDPDRRARFEREAHILASLNHSNIAAIHAVEERALIMELVEGHPLSGPLAVETAVNYGVQIARALEAAHEKGIVHRDLKPGNVMITSSGTVKVLDFGLARISGRETASDPGNSATLTISATGAGLILGTAAYMSPEQARGSAVDRRADIWAFGCVLYEMLTGKPAFHGETVSDILAGVIKEQPDLSRIPAHLRPIIEKCLRKDPQKRWRDIGDVRIALEDATPDAADAPHASPRSVRLPWILFAAACVAAIGAGTLALQSPKIPPGGSQVYDVDLGPDAVTGRDTTMVLSNDGSRMVFPVKIADGQQGLAIRFLNQRNAVPLTGTENAANPFFSPDGEWVGFFVPGKVKKIPARGGTPVTLYSADGVGTDGLNLISGRGATWSDKGFIVMSLGTGTALTRISDQGGQPEPVTKRENGEDTHRWPQLLPDGNSVLFTASTQRTNYEHATIEVVSLKTGTRKVVQRDGFFARYIPSGHLVFLRDDTLWAVPFDVRKLETHAAAVPVLEGIAGSTFGGGQYTFAANGTFTYLRGTLSGTSWEIQSLDSTGKAVRLLAPAAYFDPRLSPDGTKLAYNGGRGENNVWIADLERQSTSRITFLPNRTTAHWTPDGKHILFASSDAARQRTLYLTRADGSGEPLRLARIDNYLPAGITPDSRAVLLERSGPSGSEIAVLRIDWTDATHPKVARPETLLRVASRVVDAELSPDGKWLSYSSQESGASEVYVRPFQVGKLGEGRWQISSGEGTRPRWSRNMRTLFYLGRDLRPMFVDYKAEGDSFQARQPVLWADKMMKTPSNIPVAYDVTPDGKRIVFTAVSEDRSSCNLQMVLVLNFFDELRRRFL